MPQSTRPTTVAGLPLSTIDQGIADVSSQAPLTKADFAKVWTALHDPTKAAAAAAWLSGNNVSTPEREAFEQWANKQPKPTDLNNRVDSNMATVAGVGIAPEDVLAGGMAARGVKSAVQAAPAGAKLAAGALSATGEAAPYLKYEAIKRGLMFAHVPEPIAALTAAGVSGYSSKGGKGGGKAAAAEKAPLTASEQLGVSPTATGAVMDTLPNTPVPDRTRVALPLAHQAQAGAEAADLSRANAASLGVESDVTSPGNMPLGVGDEANSLALSSRERIPMPPPQDTPLQVKTKKVSTFEDVAKQLGLDTSKMTAEPDMAVSHVSEPEHHAASGSPTGPAAAAAAAPGVQTSGVMRGAPAVTMPPDEGQMDRLVGKMGGMEPPPGLTPSEQAKWVREELAKELMSRETFRDMGTGTRKRGVGYTKPQDED